MVRWTDHPAMAIAVDWGVKQQTYKQTNFTRGSTENFVVPCVSGVAGTTFYYSGAKDWNSLPSDVKQKCTFNGFKSAAKQCLRTQLQLMGPDTYVYYKWAISISVCTYGL